MIYILALGYWINVVGKPEKVVYVYSLTLVYLFSRILFLILYYIATVTGIHTLRSSGFILSFSCVLILVFEGFEI